MTDSPLDRLRERVAQEMAQAVNWNNVPARLRAAWRADAGRILRLLATDPDAREVAADALCHRYTDEIIVGASSHDLAAVALSSLSGKDTA